MRIIPAKGGARLRFSFLSDLAGLYRFRRHGRRPTTTVLFVFANYISTYKNHVILGLAPRIHAASHGPTNVVAEPSFRGGGWFLQPGVDGRVKPDHDKVFEIARNSKPDSRGDRLKRR
jgi:hypothetical protein